MPDFSDALRSVQPGRKVVILFSVSDDFGLYSEGNLVAVHEDHLVLDQEDGTEIIRFDAIKSLRVLPEKKEGA